MDTTQQAFRDYLTVEKNYSMHTVNGYAQDLLFFQEFLQHEFNQDNLVQVNYSQIRSWIVYLVDQGISSSSINRKIASLKAYYKFLLKINQISVSPLLKHKALKTPKLVQVPFSENELHLVLNQLEFPEGFAGIRDKLMIEFFYTTGIRRAELIGLKIAAVDVSNQTIKVVGKRNKERIIPMLPIIASQIKTYLHERASLVHIKDKDSFFLSEKGVKLSESFVYRTINYYFSTSSEKVKKSPHILRHTFATHLLNNGADINSVKELLGHSSLASTQVYTHSSLAELKKTYGNAHPRSQK